MVNTPIYFPLLNILTIRPAPQTMRGSMINRPKMAPTVRLFSRPNATTTIATPNIIAITAITTKVERAPLL